MAGHSAVPGIGPEQVARRSLVRSRLLTVFVPLTAALFLIGEALTPKGLDQTPMTSAAALKLVPIAAAHTSQLYLSNMILELGLGALAVSYVAIAAHVRYRGWVLATVGALIGATAAFFGAIANVLVGFNLAAAVASHIGPDGAAQFVSTTFSSKPGEAFLNGYFLGNIVAMVLVATALWRSRVVPRWVPFALPISFELAASAPAGVVSIPLMVPFLVVTLYIATVLWSSSSKHLPVEMAMVPAAA